MNHFNIILVATCSRPKIPNAMIHPDKQTYEYNETVRFSCRLGFRLIGAFVKSCQQDGHFEGDIPSCTGTFYKKENMVSQYFLNSVFKLSRQYF